ncbi:hypothetical protein [Bradyrhizobium sp. MOS001]|uniref:hypothetical protein n=1 Tax=Bradyrhizobium sp. MOS001 TaxID=2133948 RepID=UPI001FCEB60A|nr:hypothetical protein [Bradyrhizobium sp. MOS001]
MRRPAARIRHHDSRRGALDVVAAAEHAFHPGLIRDDIFPRPRRIADDGHRCACGSIGVGKQDAVLLCAIAAAADLQESDVGNLSRLDEDDAFDRTGDARVAIHLVLPVHGGDDRIAESTRQEGEASAVAAADQLGHMAVGDDDVRRDQPTGADEARISWEIGDIDAAYKWNNGLDVVGGSQESLHHHLPVRRFNERRRAHNRVCLDRHHRPTRPHHRFDRYRHIQRGRRFDDGRLQSHHLARGRLHGSSPGVDRFGKIRVEALEVLQPVADLFRRQTELNWMSHVFPSKSFLFPNAKVSVVDDTFANARFRGRRQYQTLGRS